MSVQSVCVHATVHLALMQAPCYTVDKLSPLRERENQEKESVRDMSKKNATKKNPAVSTVSYVIRNNSLLLHPQPSELADVLSDEHLKLLVTVLNSKDLTPKAKIKRLRSDIFAYYDNLQFINLDTVETSKTATPVSESADSKSAKSAKTVKKTSQAETSFVQRFTVENPLVLPNPLSENPSDVIELVEAPIFRDPIRYVTHFAVIFKTASEDVESLRSAPKTLVHIVSMYERTNTVVCVKLRRDEHNLPTTDVFTMPIDYLHFRKIHPMNQTYNEELNSYMFEYDTTKVKAHFIPMMLKDDYMRYMKRSKKQSN